MAVATIFIASTFQLRYIIFHVEYSCNCAGPHGLIGQTMVFFIKEYKPCNL